MCLEKLAHHIREATTGKRHILPETTHSYCLNQQPPKGVCTSQGMKKTSAGICTTSIYFFYFIFKRTKNEIKQYLINENKQCLISGLTVIYLCNKHILGGPCSFFMDKDVKSKQVQRPVVLGGPSEVMQPPQRLKDGMMVGFPNQRCFVSTIPSQ